MWKHPFVPVVDSGVESEFLSEGNISRSQEKYT